MKRRSLPDLRPIKIPQSTQTERPSHRSTQVQTKGTANKKTQTKTDVNRPDRFDTENIRTENEVSGFETWFFGEYQLYLTRYDG